MLERTCCHTVPSHQAFNPKGERGSSVDDEHYGRSPALLRLLTGRLWNSPFAIRSAALCGGKEGKLEIQKVRSSCLEWLHYSISVRDKLINTDVHGFYHGVIMFSSV